MSFEKHTILIVDDNEAMRKTLAANFEAAGYGTIEAESGAAALDHIRQRADVSLMVSDIRMPGMSGVDTFKIIRSIRADLPVIMMTAYSVEEMVMEALMEGAYTVIHKPFDLEGLFQTVARALNRPIVLILDSADESDALLGWLREHHCRSGLASSLDEAMSLLETAPVDVVLMNVSDEDALQSLQKLRARNASLPIIVLSWSDVPELLRRAASIGAYTCLRKPVEMPELIKVVAEVRRQPY